MEHNHVASQTDRRGDPGTYLITDLINEEDLLTIANQIARQKLAKGEAITDKHLGSVPKVVEKRLLDRPL